MEEPTKQEDLEPLRIPKLITLRDQRVTLNPILYTSLPINTRCYVYLYDSYWVQGVILNRRPAILIPPSNATDVLFKHSVIPYKTRPRFNTYDYYVHRIDTSYNTDRWVSFAEVKTTLHIGDDLVVHNPLPTLLSDESTQQKELSLSPLNGSRSGKLSSLSPKILANASSLSALPAGALVSSSSHKLKTPKTVMEAANRLVQAYNDASTPQFDANCKHITELSVEETIDAHMNQRMHTLFENQTSTRRQVIGASQFAFQPHLQPSNKTHKPIDYIQFGPWRLQTQSISPYPLTNPSLHVLYVCEWCCKYMETLHGYQQHVVSCGRRHPPGRAIYRKDHITIYEIDGALEPLYCQCLCLLSKLFIDSKTVTYDVQSFLFYVMTIDSSHPSAYPKEYKPFYAQIPTTVTSHIPDIPEPNPIPGVIPPTASTTLPDMVQHHTMDGSLAGSTDPMDFELLSAPSLSVSASGNGNGYSYASQPSLSRTPSSSSSTSTITTRHQQQHQQVNQFPIYQQLSYLEYCQAAANVSVRDFPNTPPSLLDQLRHQEKAVTHIYTPSKAARSSYYRNTASFYRSNSSSGSSFDVNQPLPAPPVHSLYTNVLPASEQVTSVLGQNIVGYYSKEKVSSENYNLSCIVTFPQHQRHGYGNLLIDLSYQLTKLSHQRGTPEKPLSFLGMISYRSYWVKIVLRHLLNFPPSQHDLRRKGELFPYHELPTLQDHVFTSSTEPFTSPLSHPLLPVPVDSLHLKEGPHRVETDIGKPTPTPLAGRRPRQQKTTPTKSDTVAHTNQGDDQHDMSPHPAKRPRRSAKAAPDRPSPAKDSHVVDSSAKGPKTSQKGSTPNPKKTASHGDDNDDDNHHHRVSLQELGDACGMEVDDVVTALECLGIVHHVLNTYVINVTRDQLFEMFKYHNPEFDESSSSSSAGSEPLNAQQLHEKVQQIDQELDRIRTILNKKGPKSQKRRQLEDESRYQQAILEHRREILSERASKSTDEYIDVRYLHWDPPEQDGHPPQSSSHDVSVLPRGNALTKSRTLPASYDGDIDSTAAIPSPSTIPTTKVSPHTRRFGRKPPTRASAIPRSKSTTL